ncbi:MAG: hypothetical protein Q8R39_02725 [bacterium]|nr:hypothetical protein [bacterium]MDZ4284477.1 hypothetical protein [Patescibacteria group bacterium]
MGTTETPETGRRGITMVELMLSVAFIAVLSFVSLGIYRLLYVRNDLDLSAAFFAQLLRRAQVHARAVDGDSPWGVFIAPGSITLFRGVDYASRAVGLDETHALPLSVSPAGLDEIVFTKFTGVPQSTGATTLTSTDGEVRTIVINEHGTVSY